MTSKEALTILFMTCDDDLLLDNYDILFASKLEEIIRKDLDKLEYYKTHPVRTISEESIQPTEEEVLKEFEKLGYKKYNTYHRDYIELRNEEKCERICIDLDIKTYMKIDTDNLIIPFGITLQEHRLLTKLFKAWGWLE